MLSPWDESYKRTKAIKTGAAELHSPFSEMVQWMNEFYRDIGAINAWVDASDHVRKRPALRVAFERDEALARFEAGANFNRSEQQRVGAHFVKLLGQLRVHDIEIDGLFATFHAFESCALWEANSHVTDEDLLHLAISLGDLHVWKAYREFASAVFFFDTDEHLRASKTNGARDVCARRYASVTDRYDEFGYLRERPIAVEFYSKQSFDRDFHGNWFFFSRRGSLSFDREDPETWGEVRRNASCPCGSGKRFKHCHGKAASA